jgi:integrase
MASIRLRIDAQGKKTYQAQVRVTGHPHESRTFNSKTDAQRWARQTETDIQSGTHIRQSKATTKTVADLLTEYEKRVLRDKTTRGDKGAAAFAYWREHLGPYALARVTPKLVEEHRDRLAREKTLRNKPRAPATVLRYMMVLSHAYSTAIRWEWCERNPVEIAVKPQIDNKRVRYLRDDERQRLLDACRNSENKDLYLVVVIAICTGMRRGEIMNMRWAALEFHDDLGFAKLQLNAKDTKNKTDRNVLIGSHAFDLLTQRREGLKAADVADSPTGLIFPSYFNPKNPVDLRAPWEAALKAAGVSDFRFHDLRHTTASYLAMNGATTLEIKEALGHKSTAMAERYSHVSQSHMDNVVLRMNERHFGAIAKGKQHSA